MTGGFSGAVSGCATGTTSGSGSVSFTNGSHKSGSVGFCVTAVTGTDVSFDSAGNCAGD